LNSFTTARGDFDVSGPMEIQTFVKWAVAKELNYPSLGKA